jgi:hypothetical protein
MDDADVETQARARLADLAREFNLDVTGGKVRKWGKISLFSSLFLSLSLSICSGIQIRAEEEKKRENAYRSAEDY